MLMIVLLLILIIIPVVIFFLGKDKYNEILELVDSKEYPLKKLFPIGFLLLDVIKYKFKTRYDKTLLSSLREIYGPDKCLIYLKVYWSNKIILILFLSFIAILVASFMKDNKDAYQNIVENVLIRPQYGRGDMNIPLTVTLEREGIKYSEDIRIKLKQQKPTDEEAINTAVRWLTPDVIKGKNLSLQNVTTSLNLMDEISELGVTVSWISDKPHLINSEGTLHWNNHIEEEIVTLIATLKKGEYMDSKEFTAKINFSPSSTNEATASSPIEELKVILAKELDNYEAVSIQLPLKLIGKEDIKISWALTTEVHPNRWLKRFLVLLVIVVLLVYFLNKEVGEKAKKRSLLIKKDFPDLLNKFILLTNAGMNPSRAIEKIVIDTKNNNPIYQELRTTYHEIKGGKAEEQAYEDFSQRCRTTEVTKFVTILLQNQRKGNAEMTHIFKLQADECWQLRKTIAKQLGEEASTKLLMPMMIMFLAILLIVIAPAVLSLQGM